MLPLRGLNKRGGGRGDFYLHSANKIPHITVFSEESDAGIWFQRLTFRELLGIIPPEHGIHMDSHGEVTLWGKSDIAVLKAKAIQQIKADRAWASDTFGTSLPQSFIRPDSSRIKAALQPYPAGAISGVIRLVDEKIQASLHVENQDIELSSELIDASRDFKQQCFAPGIGAPFSFYLELDNPDGQLRIRQNWDHEPRWQEALTASDYARDLERFPRIEPWIPDWLLIRLRQAQQ